MTAPFENNVFSMPPNAAGVNRSRDIIGIAQRQDDQRHQGCCDADFDPASLMRLSDGAVTVENFRTKRTTRPTARPISAALRRPTFSNGAASAVISSMKAAIDVVAVDRRPRKHERGQPQHGDDCDMERVEDQAEQRHDDNGENDWP